VVRSYLVLFKSGVSGLRHVLRKFSGARLAEIDDQSFALHLMYLQCLLSTTLLVLASGSCFHLSLVHISNEM
jgi:hypothetical protein